MQVPQFIRKWQDNTQTERAVSQSHFNDLCELLGVQKPTDADPAGSWFCFEYGAEKASGGDGWADVFRLGYFGWEYKGKRKDLDAAYQQLLDYRMSLFNPPLLIACDLNRFVIHTNFQNSPAAVYEFELEELAAPSKLKPDFTNLELLHFAFEDPNRLRVGEDPLKVTEQAAKNVGDIALRMQSRGIEPLKAAHFVMKLVFCMFAEWTKLLPERFLTKALHATRNNWESGAAQTFIEQLFSQMDAGGWIFTDEVPQFNGGLFDGSPPIPLENGEVRVLRQACEHDWSRIEPSVFGTLLERAIDPKRKQQLGAHYTRPEDVMKVIEPVVLDPLREEWITLRAELELLVGPKDLKGRQRRVEGFLKRLATVRILDPACGSGNFLYLALRAVMDLEEEVLRYAHKQKIPVLTMDRVGPEILLGREIDPYAKELASTVIWIGYIQHRLSHSGSYDDRPILRPLENIVLADSILDPATGERPEWPECDFIVGNPPFLGFYRQREALGENYNTALHDAYRGIVEGQSDLCCFFFEQARQHIMGGKAKRAGLLATNSIRQGDSRRVLDRINTDTPIFNTWNDEEWILDGANVRISIVCFGKSNLPSEVRRLDGQVVQQINSDLSAGQDLMGARQLAENAELSFLGDLKGGAFDVDKKAAERMLEAKNNPNGRPNSDVLKPKITGKELLSPYIPQAYRIDFGTDMSVEAAAQYVLPFIHIKSHVHPLRINNREKVQRERWWIHMRPRPEMRKAIHDFERYLVTPEVTNTRAFLFLDRTTIPDHTLIVFAFEDWYRFGILQSSLHTFWTRALASDLRGWTRYTPTTVFETFPFPCISPHLRKRYPLASNPLVDHITGELRVLTASQADRLIAAVEQAAEELYVARDRVVLEPGTDCPSYTKLYKANPPWLQQAHAKLDRAVLACYGLPPDAGKHEILAHLLAENLAREPRQSKSRKTKN